MLMYLKSPREITVIIRCRDKYFSVLYVMEKSLCVHNLWGLCREGCVEGVVRWVVRCACALGCVLGLCAFIFSFEGILVLIFPLKAF